MSNLIDVYLLAISFVTLASIMCNSIPAPKGKGWKSQGYAMIKKFALLSPKAKK